MTALGLSGFIICFYRHELVSVLELAGVRVFKREDIYINYSPKVTENKRRIQTYRFASIVRYLSITVLNKCTLLSQWPILS